MSETADLLSSTYQGWLADALTVRALPDGITVLTTPFVDRHNDHLQLYAEARSDGTYLLTDDGYVLAELRSSGVENRGARREEIIRTVLAGHGVSLQGDELYVVASAGDLGQRTHDLVQAMLSLDDLFVLAPQNVRRVFQDDVRNTLQRHRVRFEPDVRLAGKSGLKHQVSFMVPESGTTPERALQVVNTPRRDRVEGLLFTVNDIRRVRGEDTRYYAVVDDSRRPVPREFRTALDEYSVVTVPGSALDGFAAELSDRAADMGRG